MGLRKIIVLAIVIIVFGLSLSGTFSSPNIDKPNEALTYNEVNGIKWLYSYKDGQQISAPVSQLVRFHHLFNDGNVDTYIDIPDHFGYNVGERTFTESVLNYSGTIYIVTMTIDVVLYEEVSAYKSVGRYTYGDYDRFLLDKSINRVYSSQNIDISFSYR